MVQIVTIKTIKTITTKLPSNLVVMVLNFEIQATAPRYSYIKATVKSDHKPLQQKQNIFLAALYLQIVSTAILMALAFYTLWILKTTYLEPFRF
ncbi:MAG: hypothetical protein HQL71_07500 [Magnetococcales bacterium]|nr:hypothetical protein [Magnetococcales bacterium]